MTCEVNGAGRALTAAEPDRPQTHIVQELGFTVARGVDGGLRGSAQVFPEMLVPGHATLRASILATFADISCGLLAVDVFTPRVPVTLGLDVHVYQQQHDMTQVTATARILKAGTSVVVAVVDFSDGAGHHIAVGSASFMAVPDPTVTIPHDRIRAEAMPPPSHRLAVPFAQRAGCERREPGVAFLPRRPDGLNSSNTVNGGLIALAVEEAALSLSTETTLASMTLRYLRPVRLGPVVATALQHGGVALVEVRDAGAEGRLAVDAVTRTF